MFVYWLKWLTFFFLTSIPLCDFYAWDNFGNLGYVFCLHPLAISSAHFSSNCERCYTQFLEVQPIASNSPVHKSYLYKWQNGPVLNSALFNVEQKGGPTLYFICHHCFSLLQQCSIVSMKISGSMKRRILYYYVPAKFRSLFSFCCSQRAHNLLSTMRQATKLHCCSPNRLVLVDGLTRCEVCLSAAAAEGSLGTPSPQQAQRKRNDKRKNKTNQKKEKERKRGNTTSSFSCLCIFFSV